jgi:capsular polysaccharide transport system permease protein
MFLQTLNTQKNIVYALYLREQMARFGKYSLGYLWALIEPIVHVTVLSVIFYAFSKKSAGSFDFPLFVMSGILPWLLFKNIISKTTQCISTNSSMFYFQNIRPIDLILARAFMELNINIGCTIVLLIAFYFIGYDIHFDDFLLFSTVMILIFMLSLGIGLFTSVAQCYKSEISRVVTMTFRPLYLLSGVFFSINVIPEQYREILLLNPLIHAIQLVRESYQSSFHSGYVELNYLVVFSLGSLFLGLLYYSANWKKILDE